MFMNFFLQIILLVLELTIILKMIYNCVKWLVKHYSGYINKK
jgi:hypothetical protein